MSRDGALRPGYCASAARFYWPWMCGEGIILLKHLVLTLTGQYTWRREHMGFEKGTVLVRVQRATIDGEMTNISSTHAMHTQTMKLETGRIAATESSSSSCGVHVQFLSTVFLQSVSNC